MNKHEFCSNELRIPVSSKNTRFSGSMCLIFSQYSNLNFWTLSVAAWLLDQVFFCELILISAAQRHIADRLTQFPVLCANNSHNSTCISIWTICHQCFDLFFRIRQMTELGFSSLFGL